MLAARGTHLVRPSLGTHDEGGVELAVWAPRYRATDGAPEVLATDPGSVKDVAAWSRATGNALVEQTVDGGVYRFVLRRK